MNVFGVKIRCPSIEDIGIIASVAVVMALIFFFLKFYSFISLESALTGWAFSLGGSLASASGISLRENPIKGSLILALQG